MPAWLFLSIGLAALSPGKSALPQSQPEVVAVSAANFAPLVTPDSIVAAFGAHLATGAEAANRLPLPTTLAGVSVKIGGRAAGLFYASPGQLNLLVPPETAPGNAPIEVRAYDGTLRTGVLQIANAAPAVFTAAANGRGVPAATALRVAANGAQTFEPVAQREGALITPRPLSLGPQGEKVFLILSLCGIRRLPNGDANGANGVAENVRVILGGGEYAPAFAGAAPGFAGLDQINLELPRALIGRGRLQLAVSAGGVLSNPVELEIAGSPNSPRAPLVASFAPATVFAGEPLTVNGSNFEPAAASNTVIIGGNETHVIETATATHLTARAPYGVESGLVAVRTPQGEGVGASRITVGTSASGFAEDTRRNPLPGVKVKILETGNSATTNNEGVFLLRNPPTGAAKIIEVDPTGLPLMPALTKVIVKAPLDGNRDNHLGRLALQQVIGPGLLLGPAPTSLTVAQAGSLFHRSAARALAPAASINTGGVTFTVPDNVTVVFPDGAPRGVVYLTVIENSRTPVELPPGVFSSTIVQLTPFGVKLSPGGSLSFPNADSLPANTAARLYKLDQTPGSRTIGEFVDVGAATVSADGQRVTTAANALTETSIYFVAVPRPVTTLVGRVVDNDGATPVRYAGVSARGQETFTDGAGGFLLRNVPLPANNIISVEASYQRPTGRVDRVTRNNITAVANAVTRVTPELVLPAPVANRPPTLIAPPTLSLNEGETANSGFIANDPDPNQTVQVTVSSAPFITVAQSQGVFSLRLTPGANTAGAYALRLTATDNLGLSTAQIIALTIIRPNRAPVAANQSLTVAEDAPLALSLNASDADNDPLTYAILSPPQHGVLTGAGAARSYLPARDYHGADSFTFKANDGKLDSNPATVTIMVTPVNDAPVLTVPGGQIVTAGQTLNFTVSATDVDAGQTLNFFATGLPTGATFTAATRRFAWTPAFDQAGNYAVTFNVADNGSPQLGDTQIVAITVTPAPAWTQTAGPTGGSVTALDASTGRLFVGGYPGGLYQFNGAGWAYAGLRGADPRAVRLDADGNIYAGLAGGVFLSTNNGASFTPLNNGLTNLDVRALELTNTGLLAGTGGGVFRSTNNGASWSVTGLNNQAVRSLKFAGNRVYAGTEAGGVFRSTDDGVTWTRVNTGLTNLTVSALLVNGLGVFAGTNNGVFLSTNEGASWNALNTGLGNLFIAALVNHSGEIYAGTLGGGIYRLVNSSNWVVVNNGLSSLIIRALVSTGGGLYAGGDGGVYFSADNGANWTTVNNGLLATFPVSLAARGTNVYCGTYQSGLYRSPDNGASWLPANLPVRVSWYPTVIATDSAVFAGSYGLGVFRSTDNGVSWTAVNTGLGNLAVFSFAVNGASLYAGTDNGVYVSTNNGASWTAANAGIARRSIRALAFSGGSLLAADPFVPTVYRSTDNGASWTPSSTGLGAVGVGSLLVKGASVFAGTNGGVFVSNNNGVSWTAANTGLSGLGISSLTTDGTNLYAATGGGVFVSSNNGASWTALNNGLSGLSTTAILAHDNRLLVGTFGAGVFARGLSIALGVQHR